MQPLRRILKKGPPLLLAQEVAWRIQKRWEKRRILAQLNERRSCPVTFRNIPYYRPAVSSLNKTSQELLIAFADEVCEGRFPFMGYGTVDLSRKPKWNVDFVSGMDWPAIPLDNRHCMRFDASDVKVPYELSRLQFLPVLGKAHLITGDERYRDAAKELLSDWMQANPVGVGVNWSLAMEAALRSMSICFLLNLLSPLRAEEQSWLTAVTSSLWQHLVYIEAHIEFSHLISSNHYLSNIVALYCLSLFLEGAKMEQKRRHYRERIEATIVQQVYEDGGDYEASTGYHVLVTQMFFSALLLMRASNDHPGSAFLERARRMNRVMADLASPSGELPHLGDCDDGRVELLLDDVQQMLMLPVPERNSLRVSNLLGLGKCLFGEGSGSVEDAAWYGLSCPNRTCWPQPQINRDSICSVKVLLNSGIAVLRHGSAELLFFAVPNGIAGKGSHTHNDKLSFVLRVSGQEVLCDCGTGCYTRDIAMRNRFRGTAAHNTLLIDGTEQNRIDDGRRGLFILGNEALVSRIEEGREGKDCFVRASHAGYRSLGVSHVRTIRSVGDERSFVVEDELLGNGIHDFEFNLQLAPNRNAQVSAAEDGILCRILGDPQVELTVSGPAGLQGAIQPSLVSSTFGATIPAWRLRFWGRAVVPARITTRMSWADRIEMASSQPDSAMETKIRGAVAQGACQV